MGSPATGFAVLPAGAQQMGQNEYYYVDGPVTLHQNERGADYDLVVMPVAREAVAEDLLQPPDPAKALVRYGYVRDTGTAPVPQYGTRAEPPDVRSARASVRHGGSAHSGHPSAGNAAPAHCGPALAGLRAP